MDKELIKIVAKSLGESQATVTQWIDFYEKEIAETIRCGRMENIRVPLFGIFRVNMKKLKYLTQVKPAPKTKVVKRQKPTQ